MLSEQRHAILKATWNFNKLFSSPLPSISECSLLYPTLWNSKLLSDKTTVTLLLPCAPICSCQVTLLSNNTFFFFPRNVSIGWPNSKRQVFLVHLFIPHCGSLIKCKESIRLKWHGTRSTRSTWCSRTLQLYPAGLCAVPKHLLCPWAQHHLHKSVLLLLQRAAYYPVSH